MYARASSKAKAMAGYKIRPAGLRPTGRAMRRDFSAVTFPEIFVVRVSETVGEREGRQLGCLDSPISAKGKEQARAAGRALKHILGGDRSVCVETSPLGR